MRVYTYDEIINNHKNAIFVDLRSPAEFELETIVGAINIPIFTNQEREEIGYTYKQKSQKEAIELGLTYISYKLKDIYNSLSNLSCDDRIIVAFCARGGMRSTTVINLFESLRINVVKLDKGYKGYRAYVNKNLPIEMSKVNLLALYGKTGTGKTNILDEITKKGYDVLDFEKCANHRGSTLGSVGKTTQHTQKMFESHVLHTLINRKTDIMFCEGESKRIGNIIMPTYMYDKLESSKKVIIEADVDYRIQVIKKEYINELFKKEEMITKLDWLSKYLSIEKLELYKKQVMDEQYEDLIKDLMINYYDINYKCNDRTYLKSFINTNDCNCADEIIKYFSNEI